MVNVLAIAVGFLSGVGIGLVLGVWLCVVHGGVWNNSKRLDKAKDPDAPRVNVFGEPMPERGDE